MQAGLSSRCIWGENLQNNVECLIFNHAKGGHGVELGCILKLKPSL